MPTLPSPYVHARHLSDHTHTDACPQPHGASSMFFSVVTVLPGAQSPCALREVRVVHCLLCADTAGGVVNQHAFQEIQAVLAEDLDAIRIDHLVVLFPLPFGETALEVWEGSHARPVGFGGSTEDAEDLEDLINLRVTREERLASSHLSEDAANRPHVDTSRVLATTEQDLGCAVPESDDFVGVGAERDTKCASQTKIGQLQVAFLVDEQVLRLEITMEDAVGVAVASALEKLEGELLDLQWRVSTSIVSALVSCQHIPYPGPGPCVLDVRS